MAKKENKKSEEKTSVKQVKTKKEKKIVENKSVNDSSNKYNEAQIDLNIDNVYEQPSVTSDIKLNYETDNLKSLQSEECLKKQKINWFKKYIFFIKNWFNYKFRK